MGTITAIYVSSSQFTISGDKEQEFADNGNRKVTLKQGVDGQARVSVTASSYSAVTELTTVTVSPSAVTGNLATAEPGATDRFSTAGHTHLDSDDGGLIYAATFSESQVEDLKTMPPLGAGDTLKLLRINSSDNSYEAVDIMGSVGNRLIGVNAAGNDFERKNLLGTTNQVTVTHAAGQITLSTPQNLDTGATVQFAQLYASSLIRSYADAQVDNDLTVGGDVTISGTLYLPLESGVLVSDGAYGVAGTTSLVLTALSVNALTIPTASGILISDGAYGVAGGGALGDLDDVESAVTGSGAAGDILIRGANDYGRKAAGSEGYVLTIVSGVPDWSNPYPRATDSSTWDAETASAWTSGPPASTIYVERFWYQSAGRIGFSLDISTADGNDAVPASFPLPVTPANIGINVPVRAMLDVGGTPVQAFAYIDAKDVVEGNRKLYIVAGDTWTNGSACRLSITGEYEIA